MDNFEQELTRFRAKADQDPNNRRYWQGFCLGLQRQHYGIDFKGPAEAWGDLAIKLLHGSSNQEDQQLYTGYMAGFIKKDSLWGDIDTAHKVFVKYRKQKTRNSWEVFKTEIQTFLDGLFKPDAGEVTAQLNVWLITDACISETKPIILIEEIEQWINDLTNQYR